MNYKVLVAAALAATVVQANTVDESLPEPWFKNGQAPAVQACEAGVDSELETQGVPNVTLKCETNEEGFVGVMQQFDAANYRNSRLRYSALIRSEGIEGWGGLWMRVDDTNKPDASFDNMQNRAIKGSQEWARVEVVLDASLNAETISIGTLMKGKGQLWIRGLQLETVGNDVPVTDLRSSRNLPSEPQNLGLAR
jgi:hypothetical protein